MFEKILSFFFKKPQPITDQQQNSSGGVKQTGLIVTPPKPTDWNENESGIVSAIRMPSGDWTPYLPTGEKQYKFLGFDSMSCSTFSGLNVLETFITYLIPSLSKDHLDFFRLFNFIDENGKVNASDNFTAIMSGTTPTGNSLPNVWDSVRNDGVVSEKDFPFGGNNISEFLDKKRISDYMKRRAQKFKQYFTVQYQWVHFATGKENTPAEVLAMQNALKESPLHIGIVIPATHAEELVQYSGGYKSFFNSYEQFLSKFEDIYNPIHFSMKVALSPILSVPKFPTPAFAFTDRLALGMTNADVLALQKILMYFGFMNVATGYFGPVTVAAVKDLQAFYGLQQVGEVGPKTRDVLNSFFSGQPKPTKTNGQTLYETALKCLNIDMTPDDTIPDDVDCAETVNAVHKRAFGVEIGGGASTYALYGVLKASGAFQAVSSPIAGDIVISPTSLGNGNLSNGHVGIVGENGQIMSNSSSTGKFSQNFTMETWRARYIGIGGFPMLFFRKK